MIDKIIEELEYHKLGWENTDEYNLQRRPFIEAYSKAIEIVKRYENDGWILCSERLPENEKEVEVSVERRLQDKIIKFTCRAFYEDGTVRTDNSAFCWDNCDDFEYDEEKDSSIISNGWFESNRYSEEFVAVDDFVIAWRNLPIPYKGE